MDYLLDFAVVHLLSTYESIFETVIIQITQYEIFPRKAPDIYKQTENYNRLATMGTLTRT